MNRTGIDYLDYTWNPLAMRCTRVSPACDNCWHLRMAARKAGNPKLSDLERQASAGLIPPVLMPDRLDEPLRLKKPRRIGVQFMGDLFHDAVEWNQLFEIFQVMGMAPQHQFIVKTKRLERMIKEVNGNLATHLQRQNWCHEWPLSNIWFGITAENQEWFDRRWAYLKQIPAAKVFISHEPGLGPLILPADFLARRNDVWLACGGETGPHARPMHPDIPRKLRDDCVAAGVPFFFKSWGEWAPGSDARKKTLCVYNDGRSVEFTREAILAEEKRSGREHNKFSPTLMSRVGKKDAGRALDEGIWDEVPGGIF